ncbi:relaxase domain-containing protein [Novosphingobium resinovorum]
MEGKVDPGSCATCSRAVLLPAARTASGRRIASAPPRLGLRRERPEIGVDHGSGCRRRGIIEAHEQAVTRALVYLEEHAALRRRIDGEVTEKTTG